MKTIIAVLLLTSLSFADAPVADIKGPTERHQGALTVLDASGSAADKFAWMVDVSRVAVPKDGSPDVSETIAQLKALGFTVQEPNTETEPLWAVSDDGKRLWLSSYTGTYSVVLGVSNADGVVLMPWKVVVSGGDVPNPPDPDPIPIPVPVVIGLEKVAYDGVRSVASDSNKLEFVLLSGVYVSVANDIKAGKLTTVDQVLDRTKELTHQVLPTSLNAWLPVARQIELEMNRMRDAGLLDTTSVAAHEKPWREIGAGILKGTGVSSATAVELLEAQ